MKINNEQLEKELSDIFQKYAGKKASTVTNHQVLNDITAMFKKYNVDGGMYVIDMKEIDGKVVVKIKDIDKNAETNILKKMILSRFSPN